MRTHIIGTSALLTLALASPAIAAPLDAGIVPRDAAIVAHVDIDAIRSSSTFGVVQSKLGKKIREAKREMVAELSPIDVDLLLDAAGVTFWAMSNDAEDGALIVDGLDIRRLVPMMEKIPGHKSKRRKGMTIHSIDGEGAIAIVGSKVVLAKDLDNVVRTVDTMQGRAKSLTSNRHMPNLRGTRGSMVVIAVDDRAAKTLQKHANSALLSKGSIQGGVMELAEHRRDLVARVTVNTSGSAVAKKLSEIANGGVAFLSLAADEPDLAKLLSGLTITTAGSTVTAEIAADPKMLLDLAKKHN